MDSIVVRLGELAEKMGSFRFEELLTSRLYTDLRTVPSTLVTFPGSGMNPEAVRSP